MTHRRAARRLVAGYGCGLVVAPALIALLLVNAAAPARICAQVPVDYEALETFNSLLAVVRGRYVDSVDLSHVVWGAMQGVVRSLDPFSRVVPREQVAREAALERGELGTLGFTLEAVDGLPTVVSVVAGGPADRKGVVAGDRLVGVNDTVVREMEVPLLALHLARPPGSRVTLVLERGPRFEPDRYEITMRTAVVPPSLVPVARLLDLQTGYVRLASFQDGAPAALGRAIARLVRDGARRLVLDLRGNPGGRVAASVEVAALFLPRYTVVFRTRGRRVIDRDYATSIDGRFGDLPLVLMIDAHTASAAEAVAGSLQDHDRAVVVGARSFGKALVQEPFPLPGGAVAWLTVARALTPRGRFIQRPYEQGPGDGRTVSAADTGTHRSDVGRGLRGGGGIWPDVEAPVPPVLPGWFGQAMELELHTAVADSVAATLDAGQEAYGRWAAEPDRWDRQVLEPFLARVRNVLDLRGAVPAPVRAQIALQLAARVVEVRWGGEARDGFLLRHDPVVRLAVAQFEQLHDLLAPPDN